MHTRLAHGPAIRAIRESLGIKHGVFAIECDISPGYLTNIEKGVKQPSPAVVAAMARRLGRSVDEITYVVTAEAKVSA
jgi:transcriptional regulator with XRE-family HTH domain